MSNTSVATTHFESDMEAVKSEAHCSLIRFMLRVVTLLSPAGLLGTKKQFELMERQTGRVMPG